MLGLALTCLLACAPSRPSTPPAPNASPQTATDTRRATTSPTPRGAPPPIDLNTLEVVSSATTIYMWGGLHTDRDLDAPAPLTPGVLRPGGALTLVRVHCRVQGVGATAKVRCSAAGRTPTPPAGQSWHDRARACTQLRTRAPSKQQVRAVQRYLDRTLKPADATSPTAGEVQMIQSLARVAPPVADASAPTLLEVVFTFSWRGPETRTGGCENVDPSMQGCDPFTVKTGRTVTHTRTTVRYAYSGAPEQELSGLFLGRAPRLYGAVVGPRNAQDFVQPHPRLRLDGNPDGPDAYYRTLLGAYQDFEDAADHRPQVRAAITLNKAILALRIRDLARLKQEMSALRALADREDVDANALKLDTSLAVFDRVLAGEWLLEDPCADPG